MKFIFKAFVLVLLLFSISSEIQAQTWKWAKSSISGSAYSNDIAVDKSGNTYITGSGSNSTILGSITFSNPGFFIAKLDSSGNVLWVRQSNSSSGVIGGFTNGSGGNEIAVDANGNSYVTGSFSGVVSFSGTTLTAAFAGVSTFLAKYDTNGNLLWAKRQIISNAWDSPRSFTIDQNGNSIVTGNLQHSNGPGTGMDIYILKCDAAGNQVWLKFLNGTGIDSPEGIDVDKSGNFYLTGIYFGTITIGSTVLPNSPSNIRKTFLAKFDSNGNAIWASQILSGTIPHSLKVDKTGNIYIAGRFPNTITFGAISVTSNGLMDAFLVRFDNLGNIIWLRKGGGNVDDTAQKIAIDSKGLIYLTGFFHNTATFGNFTLTANNINGATNSERDVFIINYDSLGNEIWAKKAGGDFQDEGLGIVADTAGFTYVTGYYANTAKFDSIVFPLNPTGNFNNIFVAKLGKAGPPPNSISLGPIADTLLCSGATFNAHFSTTGIFSPGNIFTIQLSDSSGSFASPTFIGSGAASPIAVTIPSTIASGSGYKIRIISSAPNIISQDSLFSITVINLPVSDAGPDETVCINNGEIQLTGASPAGGFWSGVGTDKNGIFDPRTAGLGQHTLIYSVQKGVCTSFSEKIITVLPTPEINAYAFPNRCSISENIFSIGPFTLTFNNNSKNAESFFWEFGDGYSSTEKTPSYYYSISGTYDVYLTAAMQDICTVREKIATVQIKEQKPIPNIITPNGDNLNDTFKPEISCETLQLKIYNRWGSIVFEDPNYQNNWSGETGSSGIYYYFIRTSSGHSFKGWLEVQK